MSVSLIYVWRKSPGNEKKMVAHVFAKIKCYAVAKLKFSIKKVDLNSYGWYNSALIGNRRVYILGNANVGKNKSIDTC